MHPPNRSTLLRAFVGTIHSRCCALSSRACTGITTLMWLYGPRKVLQAWKSIVLMQICRQPCMCRATWRKVLPYSPSFCITQLCSHAWAHGQPGTETCSHKSSALEVGVFQSGVHGLPVRSHLAAEPSRLRPCMLQWRQRPAAPATELTPLQAAPSGALLLPQASQDLSATGTCVPPSIGAG